MTQHGQTSARSREVDRLFSGWARPGSPGAAVVVLKDGRIVHRAGYGCAQLEYGIPIAPDTVFHVASVSKQFTAMATAMLADSGEICLDDDIRRWLPEVPDFGHTITPRHLIHHVSGLRDQWELLMLAGWRLDDVITTEHIMNMVRHQRDLNFLPGDEHLYSNTGYTLLAELVSRVSGMSFREFTRANIFQPLGMDRTHFHDDHREIVPNRAYSYAQREDGGFRNSVLSYANVGATSLFTTVDDLARWLVNLDRAEVGGQAVREAMHQCFTLNGGDTTDYGFGLRFSRHRGMSVVGHSGSDAGFRSFCGRMPDHGLAVAILSNVASFSAERVAMQVAELFLNERMEPAPRDRGGEQPSDEELSACTGTYVMGPVGVVEVEMEDGELVVRHMWEATQQLIPLGGLRFRMKLLDATVSFRRGGREPATSLVLEAPGRTMTADRLEPPATDPRQLAAYCGDYYSEELGTQYSVATGDDGLVIRHRRLEDASLVATGDDVFVGRGGRPGRVRFVRDGAVITGFTVTGGRVRNLRFERA